MLHKKQSKNCFKMVIHIFCFSRQVESISFRFPNIPFANIVLQQGVVMELWPTQRPDLTIIESGLTKIEAVETDP